jgi:lysophospholipase L1-like esterase
MVRGLPLAVRCLVAVLAVAAAACSPSHPDAGSQSSPRSPGTPNTSSVRPVYVAVGASETLGFGASDPARYGWPRVFDRLALPRDTRFVDVGIPGLNVGQALALEVPAAVEEQPTIATVWLNVNDLIEGVSPQTYRRELTEVLTKLRRGGRTKVLVANTPPVDQLPRFRDCLPYRPTLLGCDRTRRGLTGAGLEATVAAYNRAIGSAAASTGSTVVDLFAAATRAERNGTYASLIASDGFHPSDAGHRAVARAFAAAYRKGPG